MINIPDGRGNSELGASRRNTAREANGFSA